MRKHIVLCLAAMGVLVAGVSHANVGSTGTGAAVSLGSDTLSGRSGGMQVSNVQNLFSPSVPGLSGNPAQLPARDAAEAATSGFGDQGSSESMLLAGALLVLALIIRRISG